MAEELFNSPGRTGAEASEQVAMLSRSNVRTTIVASSRISDSRDDSQGTTELFSRSVGSLGLRAPIGVILSIYNQNKPRRNI